MSKILCLFSVVFFVAGCATSSGRSPLSLHDGDIAPSESLNSPEAKQLSALLSTLGYEGVGLSYEKPETLQTLFRVFQDPRAKGREIKQVYTAVHLNYDAPTQALVIDENADAIKILAFIEGKIPVRPTIEK